MILSTIKKLINGAKQILPTMRCQNIFEPIILKWVS